MRLSKVAWITLSVGIVIIVLATLGTIYNQQSSEQQDLNSSLASAQATLPPLITEKANWENQLALNEAQLAEAQTQLGTARAKFPRGVESIETDEKLYALADKAAIEIVTLTANQASSENAGTVVFNVTPFTASVQGPVANILSFIDSVVADGYFATAKAELVNLEIPEPLTDTEKLSRTPAQIAEAETPRATISLVVYSYQREGA